jgi:hypothetical protein
VQLDPVVLPPPGKDSKQQPKTTETAGTKQKHGFLSKIGAFFAGIFH